MYLKKSQIPIFIAGLIALISYSILFLLRGNLEFIIYMGVMVFFFALILFTNKRVKYPEGILWGLLIWAILHMSGGGIYIGETRLYELMLINLSQSYELIKYDQVVHSFGFFFTTLVFYHILKPLLKDNLKKWTALSIILVMAGLGAGTLNEIIEFFATIFVSRTGVGGYINTSLDSIFNLIGALFAMVYIRVKEKSPK